MNGLRLDSLFPEICCVYRISCGGECYVGATTNLRDRIKDHRGKLSKGKHYSKLMQAMFFEHGINVMRAEVLRECEPHELGGFERQFVEQLCPRMNFRLTGASHANLGATPREAAVLAFVGDFEAKHGRKPTLAEVGDAMDMSLQGAGQHWLRMKAKGLVPAGRKAHRPRRARELETAGVK